MENRQLDVLLRESIQKLFDNDSWLLIDDLSEQSICHKLAMYLQEKFPEYNVDCEYNGNIDHKSNKKRINVLKSDLQKIGLLKSHEASNLDKEVTERAVFPDIIIHRRRENTNNLCIIEVKKSTSKVGFDYDYIKLRSYTSSYYGNNFKYDFGVFLEFVTGKENPDFKIHYYKNGSAYDAI